MPLARVRMMLAMAWCLCTAFHGFPAGRQLGHNRLRGQRRRPFPSAALTWGQLMDSLKQYVETGTGTPLPGAN